MNLWKNLSSNSRIAFIIVGLLCIIVLFGIPGLNRDWVQFPRNYQINDNSLNWANHEYGYNLMMSAEPNSIFMTEGGDNQVFSLLYFATTERMRPDIDFFDQKGNVFPRLYGDLLNTHPDEIELIRNIRDFQLFSTGRPIFLTWQRPNLEKLNINTFRQQKKKILEKLPQGQQSFLNNKYRLDTLDQLKATARSMVPKSVYDLTLRSGGNLAEQDFRYLGPWYLKNFGMVFRVTPLRYAIVDALESLNGQGDFNSIKPLVAGFSKLNMISQQFDFYVSQLENEGYVRREESKVVMVKPFRGSLDHQDPMTLWDDYRFSYLNAPNAHHWDFLTREIFANTVRTLSYSTTQKIDSLNKQRQYVSDPTQMEKIGQEIIYWNQRRDDIRKTIGLYSYDNPGMTYVYAAEMQNRELYPEAIELYLMTARANYRYSETYLRAIELILKLSEQNPDQQDSYLADAQSYLREFYQALSLGRAMTGSPGSENQLNIARNLEKRINGMRNISSEQIEKVKEDAGDEVGKLVELARLYRERGEHNQALEVLEKIHKLEPLEFSHYFTLFDYAKDNRVDIALKYLNQASSQYDKLKGDKPPLWELEYYRGGIYLNYANGIRNQDPNNKQQIRFLLQQSRKSLNNFLDQFKSIQNPENELRRKSLVAEKMKENLEVFLKEYEN